jgi:hypothetical protein
MADIVTSRIFADGEKNITAAKLNDIVGSSVIQPAFVSAKPSTSTVAPTDNLLILTAAGGTYAKAPFQTIIDSVNANLNTNAAIWSVRLRSFNAIGNPTFEVDQRNVGNTVASVGSGNVLIQDRWGHWKFSSATFVTSAGQNTIATGVNLPGTSFALTRSFFRVTLTTAQATLAAGDFLRIAQVVEGPIWRELQNDVHSLQVLVRSSVAGLSFGVALNDPTSANSLTNLLTIPTANTWTLLTLPNLPVWPGAGTFVNTPGSAGYLLFLTLACGTTYRAPANGTWQSGNFFGAIGQSNFAASPVNSTFDIAFVQHEPGPLCSTPMDCPFTQNYYACLRYFQKTYSYGTVAGTATNPGMRSFMASGTSATAYGAASFCNPMAKVPTMTLYNNATGAANSVRDGGGVDHGSGAAAYLSDAGFGAISFTTATTGTMPVFTHYTAETGW